MKKIVKILIIAVLTLSSICTSAQSDYVSFDQLPEGFNIAGATVFVNDNDYKGVITAAENLTADLSDVCGQQSYLIKDLKCPGKKTGKTVIVVGTVGKSIALDYLIKKGKLNISAIENQREASLIQVVDNPFKGVSKALILAGSDKRGTIYAVYDLCEKIGVSPWKFFLDVPNKKHNNIYITVNKTVIPSPAIEYRGIFLNDEEPCLGRWAVDTYGGFNHEFYKNVFELLLRLKCNFLWPAMWWAGFNLDDPQNATLADDMGIVMGTSHHEPMNRAYAEWHHDKSNGKWNYLTNKDKLIEFWSQGIRTMGNRETVVTMAMRGDGDEAMTEGTNIQLLETIVKDQRSIIERETGKNADQTPQVWALYKEVQDYYDNGMQVPDDITLLLCDDNWGNVRRLPSSDTPHRKGGYGMYWHFDYVGGPRSYRWINCNSLQHCFNQYSLAYDYGVKKLWIVNVGDLKHVEVPIDFFAKYCFNPSQFNNNNVRNFPEEFCKKIFGNSYARKIGDIIDAYARINYTCKPEYLCADSFDITRPDNRFIKACNEYQSLLSEALEIEKSIPEDLKSTYFQIVIFPVESCANLYKMYFNAALNNFYTSNGMWKEALSTADSVEYCFNRDKEIIARLHSINNGKWKNMGNQTHIGYKIWDNPKENIMPPVSKPTPLTPSVKIGFDGAKKLFDSKEPITLNKYYCGADTDYEMYIIKSDGGKNDCEIINNNDCLQFKTVDSSAYNIKRVIINVNSEMLPSGYSDITFSIKSNGEIFNIKLPAIKTEGCKSSTLNIIKNGYLAIEASSLSNKTASRGQWSAINGGGRYGSAITYSPSTISFNDYSSADYLEYEFYAPEDIKPVDVIIETSPTINYLKKDMYAAISIDNGEIMLSNIHWDKKIAWATEINGWAESVKNSCYRTRFVIPEIAGGKHRIKIYLTQASIVYERIVIKENK